MSDEANTRGFTGFWLPVEIIDAEGLTWTQRLIWAETHALQKGRLGKCIATNDHFQAIFHVSEGSVQNALTELKKRGWLTWKIEKGVRIMHAHWPEFQNSENQEFPKSGIEIPEIRNPVYKEKTSKNSITPLPPTGGEEFLELSQEISAKEPDPAEAIYQAYPRKEAKPAALKAIRAALKKGQVTAPQLLAATSKYALSRAGQDPKFTPHPATWFNQERWNDLDTTDQTDDNTDKPWLKGW